MATAPAGELLFVYGTLCRDRDGRLSERLVGQCRFVDAASISGRLYEIDGYPGLVYPGHAGERVLGELYRFERPSTLLLQLDDYEECSARFPQPHEYVRTQLPVSPAGGCEVVAWVYLYNLAVSRHTLIVSGDYLAHRGAGKP